MYVSYYKLSAKPFQLKPDPDFFFASKGHKRALSYLEYGLTQGEGFIVVTGEVGAGKTTLMRRMFRKLENENILFAQIVNTNIDADDTLRMVASAFGLPYKDLSKATLLLELEKFLRQCDLNGKRVLLVVDEAQNLSTHTMEELRMLSNFQTAEKSLLQIFLLGQPEFRKTMMRDDMLQLRQRVIAACHLGPLDAMETREYIVHRLHTAGWNGDPVISVDAFFEIYKFTGGIPRKINSICDRLFLFGYLEEQHIFRIDDVKGVINDIQQEFFPPENKVEVPRQSETKLIGNRNDTQAGFGELNNRMLTMERSVNPALDMNRQILSSLKHHEMQKGQIK